MKKVFFLTITIFIFLFEINITQAQVNNDGLPFTKNYNNDLYGHAGQIWSIAKDKYGNMLFGCNAGLLVYNGKSWKIIGNLSSTVTKSLDVDSLGNIFYGAERDFGIIIPDSIGEYKFVSLSSQKIKPENIDFTSVWKTYVVGNYVYYQTLEKLFRIELPLKFDKNNKLINQITEWKPEVSYHVSFKAFNKFYIREIGKGLKYIENNKPELVPGGEFFADKRIYAMYEFDQNQILIATREAGFFLFKPKSKDNTITEFQIQEKEYVLNSLIYNGAKLSDGNFAVATLLQGVIVINKNGEIIKHIDKNNVLEDNYILSIYSENDNVWLGTNEKGVYKTNLTGNFFEWNKNNGVEGVVSDIIEYNKKIYITTNTGVYFLNSKPNQNAKFQKIIDLYNCWDLEIFNFNGQSKLLVGAWDGIFEINDTTVNKIVDNKYVYKLLQSITEPEKVFVGKANGFSLIEYENNNWNFVARNDSVSMGVRSILQRKNGKIFISTENTGIFVLDSVTDKEIDIIDDRKGLELQGKDFFLFEIDSIITVSSQQGLFMINEQNYSAAPTNILGEIFTQATHGVYTIFNNNNNYYVSVFGNNIQNINPKIYKITRQNEKLTIDTTFASKINGNVTFVIYQNNNKIWFSNIKGLYSFNTNFLRNEIIYRAQINEVSTTNDSILFKGHYFKINDYNYRQIAFEQPQSLIPTLEYKNNDITINFSATCFDNEDKLQYSYRLIGYSDSWSKWKNETKAVYTNLFHGEYTFEVKARNIYNEESIIATYKFIINPPWYRTWWAYIIFIILAVISVLSIIKLYTRKLRLENEKLEAIVVERTSEIRQKNIALQQSKEEIEAQRDEIELQRDQVTEQKNQIEQQKKSIVDSIHYASRIQRALLPPDELLNEIFPEYFVLFKPRDIVSGDFYWSTQINNKSYIIAADCTGHGVPGAFMSMLGMSFLNEIVNKQQDLNAAQILNKLRENVKKSLRQTGKDNEAKDGMDIAMCIVDYNNMKLQFAGAYNPLYYIRNNEIIKVAADRMPIGIYIKEKDSFTNNEINIEKGDIYYIFSDGYIDQFGGPKGMKVRSEMFKNLLLEMHKKPMIEQKDTLDNFINNWISYPEPNGKHFEQIDDILVIGIRI